MGATEVKMKILVDTKSQKVLFAEVGKECVDFLFHILSLPIATVIRLLNKIEMAGSIVNIYLSVENLNKTYLQPHQSKDTLLHPKLPVSPGSIPLLSLPDAPTTNKTFYICPYNRCSASDGPHAECPVCKRKLTTEVVYVAPPGSISSSPTEDGGIVKGVVTYMVMDNLEVKPMSTICSITILNQFNVKDVSALHAKTVTLTMDKALKLLKFSMKSSTVLTDVFLT